MAALVQQEDPDLRKIVQQLTGRQYQDPVDVALVVPVIPGRLHERVFLSAHVNTGHGNWEMTWDSFRKRGYFPKMAAKCQEHVRSCGGKGVSAGNTMNFQRASIPW